VPATGADAASFPVAVFRTTKGEFRIQLRSDLAPQGVQHLVSLLQGRFYDEGTVPAFSVNSWTIMFGSDEPRPEWVEKREFPNSVNTRKDDNPCLSGPLGGSYKWERGTVAMMGGPHVMVVKRGNEHMGKNANDAPAGFVIEGMEVIDALFEYSEKRKALAGPSQKRLVQPGGTKFLREQFPKLDYFLSAELVANPA
jgi:cyclophilin family peptidyl-prolyl cis-trans isomerase